MIEERPLEDVDLPIVRELGEALYTAALALDGPAGVRAAGRGRSRRKGASRSKRRHGGFPHPPLMIVAAISALALAAVAAAGSIVGGLGITPDEWLAGKRAQLPTAIMAGQSAHLAILRRPRDAAWDAVNPDEAARLSRNTFVGAAGADLRLSRRARGLAGGAVWVVPGAGRICLVARPSSHPSAADRGGAVCHPDADVDAGSVYLVSEDAKSLGGMLLAGLVPDGVSTVTIEGAGRAERLDVHENVYLANLPRTSVSVSFVIDGRRTAAGPSAAPPAHLLRRSCVYFRRHEKVCGQP